MDRKAAPVREAPQVLHEVQRPHRAAAAVVRVLQRDDPVLGVVDIYGLEPTLHLLGRERAILAVDGKRLKPGQRAHGAGLVGHDVGKAVADDGVTRLAERAQAKLVTHVAAGDEQCGLLAGQLRHPRLEAQHRRVFLKRVVPDLGCGHGAPHRLGGAGEGVRAEVDGHEPIIRGRVYCAAH